MSGIADAWRLAAAVAPPPLRAAACAVCPPTASAASIIAGELDLSVRMMDATAQPGRWGKGCGSAYDGFGGRCGQTTERTRKWSRRSEWRTKETTRFSPARFRQFPRTLERVSTSFPIQETVSPFLLISL